MGKTLRRIWTGLVIACLMVAGYSAWQIGGTIQAYRQAEQIYTNLAQAARYRDMSIEEVDLTSGDTRYVSPIDFTALWAVNPDIVGWLTVEGTDIDYPIVQGEDNERYLYETADGTASGSGAIFVDYRNSAEFTDGNTIVYGHKMRNGSMFGGLTAYKEQSFAEAHRYITVYLPDVQYTYAIISAYVTDAVSDTYTVDMDEAVFGQYLRYVRDSSVLSMEMSLNGADRLLTLSTCDYTYDDARMVVHGVMVE